MSTRESIFDDPLMTPPAFAADDGSWSEDGPLRGYEVRPDGQPSTVVDVVIERDWEASGRRCILLRATEYYERGRHTRGEPAYGEQETTMVGCVHAPDLESFPAGYGGTYVTDCYPEDGWYRWTGQHWQNNPTRGESMHDMGVRKTERLAQGIASRARSEDGDGDE